MCRESCKGRSQSSWPVHSVAIKPNELGRVKVETLVWDTCLSSSGSIAMECIYTYRVYIYIYTEPNELRHLKVETLRSKETPPPGGFPIYYVPSLRTVCKRTPPERFVPDSSRGVLLHTVLDEGTWKIGNPPGGGFSFDQLVWGTFLSWFGSIATGCIYTYIQSQTSGDTWNLRHLIWDTCLSFSAHLYYICIYTYIRTARSWRIFFICSIYSLSHLWWYFPKPEEKLEAKARRSLFTEMWQKRPMGWLRVVGSLKL